MRRINLTPGFEPFRESNIDFTVINFPSGIEPHIKIKNLKHSGLQGDTVLITVRLQSLNDLILLFLATDAVRRAGAFEIRVFIPFLPFARQDRVMVTGEPLSLKVIAGLINAQGYNRVYLYDPHSDVAAALIDNVFVFPNHIEVKRVFDIVRYREPMLICPDAGAFKKVKELSKALDYTGEIIVANKKRNTDTGEITDLAFTCSNLQGRPCFISDDICDGGYTFIMLSKELKRIGAGDIHLFVSHGIFSKGLDIFDNIDFIYTTDSFKAQENHLKLTTLNLKY